MLCPSPRIGCLHVVENVIHKKIKLENMFFKSLIKKITSSSQRRKIKRLVRHVKMFFMGGTKTTIEDLRHVLICDLGLKEGDKIFVTSSFGNLNAKNYTPKDVIVLLQEIVGNDGLIMMPYYPSLNSMVWVQSKCVFDVNSTVSGMGIMTNVFSRMPNVIKSEHPFKAVCVWGKYSEYMASEHYNCVDPYGKDSPYGKLLIESNSKSLCLGVKNMPMFHSIEDLLLPQKALFYENSIFRVPIKMKNGRIVWCNTFVHSPQKCEKTMMGGEFVERFSSLVHKKIKFGCDYIYITDNNLAMEECKKEFKNGRTRLIR